MGSSSFNLNETKSFEPKEGRDEQCFIPNQVNFDIFIVYLAQLKAKDNKSILKYGLHSFQGSSEISESISS